MVKNKFKTFFFFKKGHTYDMLGRVVELKWKELEFGKGVMLWL